MRTSICGFVAVVGISASACGGTDRGKTVLLDYFKASSSGETCDGSPGSCAEDGEFCVVGADAEAPDSHPPATSCGDKWSGRCVQGVKQAELENAPDKPVCGCDRKTYSSPQEAHDQGVSINQLLRRLRQTR
ncbi:MAG: hypothetical protein ABEN55_06150, partial [Bradymonadaceae bacterium]